MSWLARVGSASCEHADRRQRRRTMIVGALMARCIFHRKALKRARSQLSLSRMVMKYTSLGKKKKKKERLYEA